MRKTRRSTNIREAQAAEDNEIHNEDTKVPEAGRHTSDSGNKEQSPNNAEADPPEGQPLIQDVWDSLREEFYEQIEQLPLSLRRTFALIGEQDREAQAYQTELLPTIRNYVKLRQTSRSGEPGMFDADGQHSRIASYPSFDARRSEDTEHISDKEGQTTEELDSALDAQTPQSQNHSTRSNDRDSTVLTGHASDRTPSRTAENSRPPLSARSQALREADATVPKSVPFPPRSKPKTSKELLTRISYLMGELIRSSEEKAGLATAAHEIVDRHIRALDIAIKELQSPAGAVFREEMPRPPPADIVPQEEVHEAQEKMPEATEVQETAPLTETVEERTSPRIKKSKKRDGRGLRKQAGEQQTGVLEPTADGIPADPGEPRYCYCNQVSYGEMIGCDNPYCAREWFHLECVGLTAPPKGRVKWYCRDCEEALHKSKKRKVH